MWKEVSVVLSPSLVPWNQKKKVFFSIELGKLQFDVSVGERWGPFSSVGVGIFSLSLMIVPM